jgi:DNA-directed RNA polymerase specialized sigma24 family protein
VLDRESGRSPEELSERSEVYRGRMEVVGELPESLGIVLKGCVVDGKTARVLANELGMPVGTVKTRLREARRMWDELSARRGL